MKKIPVISNKKVFKNIFLKLGLCVVCILAMLLIMNACDEVTSPTSNTPDSELIIENPYLPSDRTGTSKDLSRKTLSTVGDAALFYDLNSISEQDLIENLVGSGVTISNVSFTGSTEAAGIFEFSGIHDVIGISNGIILSSGKIVDVEGPNTAPDVSTDFGLPGDPDLTNLSGFSTFDAVILEFDFTVEPGSENIFIEYVFGSEEYNEWVGTQYNDTFAFFVNGKNCAVVGEQDDAVTINTINLNINSDLYINNDPFHGGVAVEDLVHTEMDGFTIPLVCEAEVETDEVNTMKLAIADAGDGILDSWVFLGEGSFSTKPPSEAEPVCVDLIAGQHIEMGDVCVNNDGENLTVTYSTTDGWLLEESHLAISTDEPGDNEWTDRRNRWQNRSDNPAPGRFPYSAVHNPETDNSYSYTIPLEEISEGVNTGDLLYIAAHAAVVHAHENPESAWAFGERFVDRGNWAMYFNYEVQ